MSKVWQSKAVLCLVYSMNEETPGVHDSPGSVETSVRRGGITNHCLIACFLCNISAKSYQNQLMCIEVIVCYIIVVFETQCICM